MNVECKYNYDIDNDRFLGSDFAQVTLRGISLNFLICSSYQPYDIDISILILNLQMRLKYKENKSGAGGHTVSAEVVCRTEEVCIWTLCSQPFF